MELEALAVDHVPKKSTTLVAVESKPVPTAGAVAGSIRLSAIPAAAPKAAALVQEPIPRILADVPDPIARQVRIASNSQVSLVWAVVLRLIAPPLKTTVVAPNLTSRVRVPGAAVKVDIRPLADTRIDLPGTQKKFEGSVNRAAGGMRLVAVIVFVNAVPSICEVIRHS